MHLLSFLAQTSDVLNGSFQVTRAGHITISGHEIPGSNLLDLVHYAVRPKRKVNEPQGWSTFLNFLNQHNVPRELLAKHLVVGAPSVQTRASADEHEGLQTDEDEDFDDANEWTEAVVVEEKKPLTRPPSRLPSREPLLEPPNLRSRKKQQNQQGKGHYKKTKHHCCWSVVK
jgi:hypothetical protein